MPIEETLEALNDVVRAGKALHIGASSMYAWQFAKALHVSDRHGWARFPTMQNYLNLLYREEEREMLPLCRAEGIGVIPWSPLARGRLTRDWDADERALGDRRLRPLALREDRRRRSQGGRARSPRWRRGSAAHARRSRSPGCSRSPRSPRRSSARPRLEQLDDAVAALTLELAPEDIAALEAPYLPHPIIGHQ